MLAGTMLASLRLRCLDIADDHATVARRGFAGCEAGKRERIEEIGRTFLAGYRAAIADRRPERLRLRLDRHKPALRGFAYEGAAMAVTLLDALLPWRPALFGAFIAGPANPHIYMAHIGAGWTLARLPQVTHGPIVRQLDPLLRWLAVDGWGFHQGYFAGAARFGQQQAPRALTGYTRRAFDQGLGRALWFVAGADAAGIAERIAALAPARHADLWSGIGLAASYAGGMEQAELRSLRQRATGFGPHLAQGAAFAAKARQRAGNPVPYTEQACLVLAGCPAIAAAAVTDEALTGLPCDKDGQAYELWRARIRAALQSIGEADAAIH